VRRKARWRVLVLDPHDPARAALRVALEAAGAEVVTGGLPPDDVLGLAARVQPDVVVLAVAPTRPWSVDAARLLAGAGYPVVLHSTPPGETLRARARAAGAMAWLFKPLRVPEVLPTVDLAVARFREAWALRRRLEARTLVERAKGLLMARHGLGEDEAYRRLRRAAMDSRRPMAEVARAVLVSEPVVAATPQRPRA
jgi:response regulator NasT